MNSIERLYEILWENNSRPGKCIILAIFILGCVAVYYALRHARRYFRDESNALDLVRKQLWLQKEADPNNLVQIETLQEPVQSSKSLIADRLKTISELRKASVKVNVNSLQQMSLLKESSIISLAIPGYVVGMAMMLGLLGTFVGLALMAQKLQVLSGSTRAMNLPDMRRDLGEVTIGLKTGFSASLLGLACSITVSAFNFVLARVQSRFYDELERFTTKELLPNTVPAVEDGNLLEDVSQQLSNGFARLETITQEHTQNVEHFKSIEEAFGQIIENIKELTHREAGVNQADVISGMTSIINQLTEVNQTVVTLTQHIPNLVTSFQKTQQRTLDRLSEVLKTQQDRMETLFKAQQPPALIEKDFHQSRSWFFTLMDSIKLFFIATLGAALLLAVFFWIQRI